MNRDFKGIWTPDVLIEALGISLAMKVSALYAAERFENPKIVNGHPLTSGDKEILLEKGIFEEYIFRDEEGSTRNAIKLKDQYINIFNVLYEESPHD